REYLLIRSQQSALAWIRRWGNPGWFTTVNEVLKSAAGLRWIRNLWQAYRDDDLPWIQDHLKERRLEHETLGSNCMEYSLQAHRSDGEHFDGVYALERGTLKLKKQDHWILLSASSQSLVVDCDDNKRWIIMDLLIAYLNELIFGIHPIVSCRVNKDRRWR